MHPASPWRRGNAVAALAATVCLAISACNPSAPDTGPTAPPATSGYQMPSNIHYTDHWVSTPAVDLMSPDGTFIRAFVEADAVRQFNIDMGKGSYPGYAAADRTRNRAGGDGQPFFGYSIRWINGFTVLPDGSATAEICSYQSITPDGSIAEGLLNESLKYQRVGAPPPANQQGPARAPSVSVFGAWYATELGAQVPITAESVAPCKETTPAIDRKNVDNSPGWPAQAN